MMSARYKFEVFMTNPYCNKCYYSFLKILHAKTSYFIKELKKAFFIAHIFFITVGAILNLYLGLKKTSCMTTSNVLIYSSLLTKSLYTSPAVSHFYGTECEIWAGFGAAANAVNFKLGR